VLDIGSNSTKIAGPWIVRSVTKIGMHLPIVQRIGLSQTDKENDAKYSNRSELEAKSDINGSGNDVPGM
jgi:hypothetical protein